MATATPTVLDYDLVDRVTNNAWNTATSTLQQFSVIKLRELKIVTRNYTKGLDYRDAYSTRQSNSELLRKLMRKAEKQLSVLSSVHSNFPYMTLHDPHGWIHLKVINDPSIGRYVSLLNIQLASMNIPYNIQTATEANTPDLINVYFQAASLSVPAQHYRTLFVIPQILQVLKTLSKKAYFENDNIRRANRSSRARRQDSGEAFSRTAGQGDPTPSTDYAEDFGRTQ